MYLVNVFRKIDLNDNKLKKQKEYRLLRFIYFFSHNSLDY